MESAVARISGELGVARLLVNCAGIAPAARIVGRDGPMDLDAFRKVIEVNLIGTFNSMRCAAAAMMALDPVTESGERGVIVSTASVAAFEGQIGQAAYSASKGGVVGLTLPAAREFSKFGIRVVTIAPGLIGTPMLLGMPREVQDSLAASVPFPKRFGDPEEYARLVEHIATNEMLNGEVIRLDGAIRMQPS
jgi:NAD(P)-dependent dehydrogenase (short-subunit alcohol dehydrogenase family)